MSIDPPIRRSLSLNALRAFEASARLGGFAPAANELLVTPGAVAAQVKALERDYGAALFERHAQGVRLTALGERVRSDFTAAFDVLEQAARDLRRLAAPRHVHIVASPALAHLWLGPRLQRLRTTLKHVEISVTAVEEPPDLKRGPFDLCLFYRETVASNQIRVCDEAVFPVCVPSLAEKLAEPSDLTRVPCIADVGWRDWDVWVSAVMPDRRFSPQGPGFSLYSISLQQALLGAGVLIGRRSLVQPHVASGALVAPFRFEVPLGLTITAWLLPEARHNEAVQEVARALPMMAE